MRGAMLFHLAKPNTVFNIVTSFFTSSCIILDWSWIWDDIFYVQNKQNKNVVICWFYVYASKRYILGMAGSKIRRLIQICGLRVLIWFYWVQHSEIMQEATRITAELTEPHNSSPIFLFPSIGHRYPCSSSNE